MSVVSPGFLVIISMRSCSPMLKTEAVSVASSVIADSTRPTWPAAWPTQEISALLGVIRALRTRYRGIYHRCQTAAQLLSRSCPELRKSPDDVVQTVTPYCPLCHRKVLCLPDTMPKTASLKFPCKHTKSQALLTHHVTLGYIKDPSLSYKLSQIS